MSNRKLVSVQEITNIDPIEGADRIEVARILGWRVVVGKDMHLKPGDRVAYFETDSLLPAYDPRYKAFQKRGQKTMIVGAKEITGHVLRTMKLRGVYSQGLIMRLDELGFRYTPPCRHGHHYGSERAQIRGAPADGRCSDRPFRRTLLQVGRATFADAHRLLG